MLAIRRQGARRAGPHLGFPQDANPYVRGDLQAVERSTVLRQGQGYCRPLYFAAELTRNQIQRGGAHVHSPS